MLEWHDLNARHEATVLWATVVLVFTIFRSADFRRSIHNLLSTLLSPSLLLPILGLLIDVTTLTVLSVILGRRVGLWETLPVVTASIWFLSTGFSLLLHLGDFIRNDNEFRRRAVALLVPPTILTQVAGVAILPVVWELFLVPVLVFVAFAVHANRGLGLTNFVSGLLAIHGIGLILAVAINLFVDPENWRPLLQAILFPILLTIGTLPYIRLLVFVERLKFYRSAKCKTVRSSEYGPDWPLTVDFAKLCFRSGAVWVEVNGGKYGLNAFAEPMLKGRGLKIFDLHEIWRDHPDRVRLTKLAGTDDDATVWKVSTDRLIRDGLGLEHQCERTSENKV